MHFFGIKQQILPKKKKNICITTLLDSEITLHFK